jgi:hypothetical protein
MYATASAPILTRLQFAALKHPTASHPGINPMLPTNTRSNRNPDTRTAFLSQA